MARKAARAEKKRERSKKKAERSGGSAAATYKMCRPQSSPSCFALPRPHYSAQRYWRRVEPARKCLCSCLQQPLPSLFLADQSEPFFMTKPHPKQGTYVRSSKVYGASRLAQDECQCSTPQHSLQNGDTGRVQQSTAKPIWLSRDTSRLARVKASWTKIF